MSQDTFGTGVARDDAQPDISTMTYEQARAELVETVKLLERGQMSLDESLSLWERGQSLAKRCEEHLDNARARVEAVLATNTLEDDQPAEGDDAEQTNGSDE